MRMRKDGLTTSEKVILTVINPLYVLQMTTGRPVYEKSYKTRRRRS